MELGLKLGVGVSVVVRVRVSAFLGRGCIPKPIHSRV